MILGKQSIAGLALALFVATTLPAQAGAALLHGKKKKEDDLSTSRKPTAAQNALIDKAIVLKPEDDVAVAKAPALTQVIGSPGEYMWGGAASTIFWVDPAEDLTVVFMTQLLPSGTFNFRGQLKTLVYPAIAD